MLTRHAFAIHLLKVLQELISRLHGVHRPLDALAGCERVTVALAKKLSSEPIETEAQWWVYELRLRISHLESLVYDFAPWLQPQFAK